MGDDDIEGQQSRLNNVANAQPLPLSPTEKRLVHLKLYRAALDGEWDIAKDIYEKYQSLIKYNDFITKRQDTALHIAVAANNLRFIEHLVNEMSHEDLALPNKSGNTGFSLAAISGNVELAIVMMKRTKDLAMVHGKGGRLPICIAAIMGHRKTVRFLYDDTKDKLEYNDKKELFISVIESDMYDIAKEMLVANIDLAIERYRDGETVLHVLAEKSSKLTKNTPLKQTGLWSKGIHLSSKQAVEESHLHQAALDIVQYVWHQVVLQDDTWISNFIGSPWRLIFKVAEKGNVDFLTILIRSYPDLIFNVDDNRYSIFHIAVLYRHEDIFKLIHKIGSIKEMITKFTDKKGNNMLHLAARIPSRESLHVVPGAALQLQRELLWFVEVMKVVQPQQWEASNSEGLTPSALMLKDHMDLMKDGEKWMKETANSCMVVATLIATVVFAAAFTIPGGNSQDNGIPIFLRKNAFKIFAVTNALSLISSVTSVLTFLSIMTFPCAIRDFYWSLPNKLIIGLVTLFISIVAMLVAFIEALFLAFDHGNRLILYAIPIAVIASVPVYVFFWLHYHLFIEMVKFTYRSKSIFRPSKSPFFTAL